MTSFTKENALRAPRTSLADYEDANLARPREGRDAPCRAGRGDGICCVSARLVLLSPNPLTCCVASVVAAAGSGSIPPTGQAAI